jgi:hypothetical protein
MVHAKTKETAGGCQPGTQKMGLYGKPPNIPKRGTIMPISLHF